MLVKKGRYHVGLFPKLGKRFKRKKKHRKKADKYYRIVALKGV